MNRRPRIRYYGPASTRTERRWRQSDRPFELDCVAPPADPDDLLSEEVDGLVCHGDETLVGPILERVGGVEEDRPMLVVFATDGATGATALERGVTHYVAVDEEFDPVEGLQSLGPSVEDHHRSRRERTMLGSLLEQVPLSVYFKDRQSRHVRVSEELTSLAEPDPSYIQNDEGKRHHTPDDVVGKTDFDLYRPDHAETVIEDDQRVMETESPIRDLVEGPFGERRDRTYVSTSKAPWYDEDGNVVGTVGITTDISERKHYEQQLERQNERLERFASVISHDLRNPLSVASGRTNAARETGDDHHFEAIEHALERMDTMIEDLLTLARDGETVDDPSVVALEPIATDAWAVVDAGDAELRVTSDTRFLADDGRLRQLFENLFRNSVEHGGDDVTVTVGDLDDGEGFFVADDGPGIPEDQRDDVFESGHTTSEQGTGLGLSIVRTIAEAHSWLVTVTESADGGARFEFDGIARPE